MQLSLVVATTRNRVIGLDNGLPWHLPDDLKFFKRITMGKPILMGRRTHESIGRPLPGRRNIVLTHARDHCGPGCLIAHSLEQALRQAQPAREIMVIGGASLYRQTLPCADRIYLTLIQADLAGDRWFPELDFQTWQEVWREEHPADTRHAHAFSSMLLERHHAP